MKKLSEHLYQAIYGLEKKFPDYSLHLLLKGKNKFYFHMILMFLVLAIIIAPQETFLVMFYLLNSFYLITQLFKLLLVIIASLARREENYIPEENLPIYTILLPVYHEDKILKNLIKAIANLDYPKHLLDVKLLIEEDDNSTLKALNDIILPEFIELIKVPVSEPRTKPKACNYGLQFARGKYVTVYDAEDRPCPQQLRKVAAKFSSSSPDLVCIQAKLNYYNQEENYLTKLFALEYTLLFDYMLVGLQKLGMPIPLGGSSNHFIRDKLNELGGWDAFNVTEDADLGIRLYHQGYRSELINSLTLEESPIELEPWLIQRARWIKGHALTGLLHLSLSKRLKAIEILGISLILYLPSFIFLFLPVYLLLSCFVVEIGYNLFWKINLLLGIILPIAYTIFVVLYKKWRNMEVTIFLSVLYYWLLPVAGVRAFWQMLANPFHWDKTEHGVSKYES
jgi:cellulose synthase/poly-beta-1,6-N-acetylglucosamine synthase-like glycosyltransferase